MPKLHEQTGYAACGTAGGRISFGNRSGEQQVLCDGGCSFWYDADHIAYLGPHSGSWTGTPGRTGPMLVNIHTGKLTILDPREGSFFAAGGRRWQVGVAGQGGYFGSCGDDPIGNLARAMTDGRGACSSDGTIALIDVYQGENNGFRLGRPNGLTFPPKTDAAGNRVPSIADGTDPYHLTVIDQNRAIWPGGSSWGTFGITPPPLWLRGSYRACWCEVNGVAYLVHWLNGSGLVARRADSKMGAILASAENVYHYDAIPWQGGIRAAWVTVDGEPPGSLKIVDWDCVSNLVELSPEVKLPDFEFSHPVMVAVFKDPMNQSAAPVEILVNQNAQHGNRPVFVVEDTLLSTWNGPLLGVYTESKGEALSKAIKAAATLKTRLLVCHDSKDEWARPPGIRAWDICGIEMYRYADEDINTAANRWRRDTDNMFRAWPGDCCVIPMYYCMGGAPPNEVWTEAEVVQTHHYLNEIVNRSPRIKVIAPFSYLRANGILPHPPLMESYHRLLAAGARAGLATLLPVPGAPPIDPIDPIDPVPTTPYPAARPY